MMQNLLNDKQHIIFCYPDQGGITCGAINEASRSSKAIEKHVIINFRNKNVVIALSRDENYVFIFKTKCHDSYDKNVMICNDIS